MNTAAKGRRHEHQIMELYRVAGYSVCRSAASKGVWDVIAWNDTSIVFIQSKSNTRPPKAEMQRMRDAVIPTNGRKFLYIWVDGCTTPTVEAI